MPGRVVCVVSGESGAALAAAERQTRPPDDIATVASLARSITTIASGAGSWLWVLDGASAPDEGWLAAMSATIEACPRADLFTGSVVGADGRSAPRWSPWFRTNPTERAMDSVARRLVPVRACPGPVLVRASAAAVTGPPRARLGAGGGLLEWTARLLRGADGYWAPGCPSALLTGAPTAPAGLRAGAAMLTGGAFTGTDRLRVGLDLAV